MASMMQFLSLGIVNPGQCSNEAVIAVQHCPLNINPLYLRTCQSLPHPFALQRETDARPP